MFNYKLKITDFSALLDENSSRFEIFISRGKPSKKRGEAIITTRGSGDETLSAMGDRVTYIKVRTNSAVRAVRMVLLLRGLDPFSKKESVTLHQYISQCIGSGASTRYKVMFERSLYETEVPDQF
jgi:hypothetical protein